MNIKTRYLKIQDELSKIHSDKLKQYGTGMYELGNPLKFWAAYFNVRRKTLRLQRLTETASSGWNQGDVTPAYEINDARAKLISDYKDLANYAIMAVQILEEDDDGI